MNHVNDQQILQSWHDNATPWTEAVREGQIDSRTGCTDQAVVEAVLSCRTNTVLDLGCGEGWLSRELVTRGCQVTGVDAVAELIEYAQQRGGASFQQYSYEEIAAGKLKVKVDTIVCNFALFADQSVEALLCSLPNLLNPEGHLVIQTLHPVIACGDQPYQDGWRDGSWAGFSAQFSNPAPWYFRTLTSWLELLTRSGFQLRHLREPIDPATKRPASVIFIATPRC